MTTGLKNHNRQNKIHNNENITIDAKHSEMINHFKNLTDSIPSLKNELKKLVLSYNNKEPSRKNDIDYILYRNEIRDKINEIKSKIQNINSNNDINKYYLDVGVLLHNYYENIENSKTDDLKSSNFDDNFVNFDNDDDSIIDDEDDIEKNENKPLNNVLNFFSESHEIDPNINVENEPSKNEGVYTSTKISDFVKHEATFKKKNILDEYLQKIDINYISRIKVDRDICNCPNCKTEMILYPSDGLQICEKCGLQQNILIESDKPSFKDPPLEICYFSYKRINHFNECLLTTKNVLKSIKLLIKYILIF